MLSKNTYIAEIGQRQYTIVSGEDEGHIQLAVKKVKQLLNEIQVQAPLMEKRDQYCLLALNMASELLLDADSQQIKQIKLIGDRENFKTQLENILSEKAKVDQEIMTLRPLKEVKLELERQLHQIKIEKQTMKSEYIEKEKHFTEKINYLEKRYAVKEREYQSSSQQLKQIELQRDKLKEELVALEERFKRRFDQQLTINQQTRQEAKAFIDDLNQAKKALEFDNQTLNEKLHHIQVSLLEEKAKTSQLEEELLVARQEVQIATEKQYEAIIDELELKLAEKQAGFNQLASRSEERIALLTEEITSLRQQIQEFEGTGVINLNADLTAK